jgi:hypothetical protein
MNKDNNTFDPTPRLKSSPVPALFIPFKNNENKCNYCGIEYSKTIEFEQKYCKNCLFWYIKYTTGTNTYLDAYIVTNSNAQCIEHKANRNNFSTTNIQEWCEYCSEISYFKQAIPADDYITNCFHRKKNCEICDKCWSHDCYQISSERVESILTKKSILILYLPWWASHFYCVVCGQKLNYIHQDSESYCQKWCSSCFIIYAGCRYCLTTNIIFGITNQSQCKKCKRTLFINIDITNLSSRNRVIDEFLFFTILDDNRHHLVADYMNNLNNYTNLTPHMVSRFIKANLPPSPDVIKWIPYSQIKNLSEIAEGGFSTIYKATWFNGTTNRNVAIKKLRDSQSISKYYLNEVISDIICCISQCIKID